jgi:hypothetical protein
MIERNPLDFLDVSPPNMRDFRTRPSRNGWFSDDLSFNPQTLLPCDGRSSRMRFRRIVATLFPANCPQFLYAKWAGVVPREALGMAPIRPDQHDQQSVDVVNLRRADAVRKGVL